MTTTVINHFDYHYGVKSREIKAHRHKQGLTFTLLFSALIHLGFLLHFGDKLLQNDETILEETPVPSPNIAMHLQQPSLPTVAPHKTTVPSPKPTIPQQPTTLPEPTSLPQPKTTAMRVSQKPVVTESSSTPLRNQISKEKAPIKAESTISTTDFKQPPQQETNNIEAHEQVFPQQHIEQLNHEQLRFEQNGKEKEQYLSSLKALVESHKHYPHTARQRRMEGAVTVRFSLLASGEITAIEITGATKILRIATQSALQRVLPLPTPPATLGFPYRIQFNVDYRLI